MTEDGSYTPWKFEINCMCNLVDVISKMQQQYNNNNNKSAKIQKSNRKEHFMSCVWNSLSTALC
jgi:hypothetical protein